MDHALRALRLFRILKDPKGEADSLNNLGAVYMFQKDHAKRLECNMKCLAIREQLGDPADISGSMNNIGETYIDLGETDAAESWFKKCLELPGAGVDSVAWAQHNLGKLFFSLNDAQSAEHAFNESLRLSKSISYHVLTTETLIQLSSLYMKDGQLDRALNCILESLEISKQTGSREDQNASQLMAAQIMEQKGDFQGAMVYYKAYHQLYTEIHDQSNIQAIKDMQFQHQLEKIRQKAEEAEQEKLRGIELQKAYDRIQEQSRLLEQHNKEITESIRYAQRIQEAVLKEKKHVSKHLPEHFILYKPKDIVSGDFYWAHELDEYLYVAAADCTGHGVPGGFLTMLGIAFLNEILSKPNRMTPAEILNQLRDKFIEELRLQYATNDGMDISLLRINYRADTSYEAVWAGANNPLWIYSKSDPQAFREFAPDKQPIGKGESGAPFTDHHFTLDKGDTVYMFSDGFHDQFGGPLGKKLKKSGFRDTLSKVCPLPIADQHDMLDEYLVQWMSDREQVDDVCVIGMRL
jgi:serine phosphatase RsbU (regulator of sigma subunit)